MKDHTEIFMLLDRSGSMQSIKSDVIGGFNSFLDDQKTAGENASLTLVQFDSGGVDTVHNALPIKGVPELNGDVYVPRGGTPLLDALGKTITTAQTRMAGIPESDRPDKVVFVVITDGQENASLEYSKPAIKALTEERQKAGWSFIYLGANQDAFTEAGAIGIPMTNAAVFAASARGLENSSASYSSNLRAYRTSGNLKDLRFTAEQRTKMVDDLDLDSLPPTPTTPTATPSSELNPRLKKWKN